LAPSGISSFTVFSSILPPGSIENIFARYRAISSFRRKLPIRDEISGR
jgi:hypothetical protein